MLDPRKRQTNWKLPFLGLLSIGLGCMISVSPLGKGQAGKYGFAPGKLPSSVQSALKQAELNPDDASYTLTAAEMLVDQGRLQGNSEAVAAADAMLVSMPGSADMVRALRLRAIAQQYLHNFNQALDLLDLTLAKNNHDATALLTRANILLVQGKLSEARETCRTLARAMRYDLFILCDTTANAIGEQAAVVANRLSAFVDSGRMDPALVGYAYSVLGEIAMFQGDGIQAQSHLEKAQKADPENLRIRMLHADSLLNLNKPEAALAALDVSANTDSLLVRRAIAYKQAGKTEELAQASKEIDSRIQGNLRAEHTGHAREEALYYLEVINSPSKALERANINWKFQREFEDARLLIDAATAANSTADAKKVQTWMRNENVTIPGLVSRLQKAGLTAEWADKLK